jgi:intracellular septation protein A
MEARPQNALSRTELRKFALMMATALVIFGSIGLWRNAQTIPVILFTMAGLLLLSGLVIPPALNPVYKAWMRLAGVLAWINTRLILGLFFCLILTPVALIMRLVRDDVLRRKPDRSCPSYWHLRGKMKPARDSYEHLY